MDLGLIVQSHRWLLGLSYYNTMPTQGQQAFSPNRAHWSAVASYMLVDEDQFDVRIGVWGEVAERTSIDYGRFDINALAHFKDRGSEDLFFAGVTYRHLAESIVLSAGVYMPWEKSKIRLGYAYEKLTSNNGTILGDTHEVSLAILFPTHSQVRCPHERHRKSPVYHF